MNEELKIFINNLIDNINKKNSWGKNELKELILDTLTMGVIK